MTQVEQKLRRDIVSWIESAERLTTTRLFIVYSLYFWLGELFVLLVGLGFSHPAFRVLAPQSIQKADTLGNSPIISGLGEGILFWVAVVGLLSWGLLKLYTQRNDLEKRCSLMKSGLRQFRQFRGRLPEILLETNPLDQLTELQREINAQVNRMVGEDAWPWRGPAPDIGPIVDTEVRSYVERYGDNWTGVPSNSSKQQQQPKIGEENGENQG
jgi:hypothetical protein